MLGQYPENVLVVLGQTEIHVGDNMMPDIDGSLNCDFKMTLGKFGRVIILAELIFAHGAKFP